MTLTEEKIEEILSVVQRNMHGIDTFRENVAYFFIKHPDLNGSPPIIHSVKSRLKDQNHVREKINRKYNLDDSITPANVFDHITDIGGVRVLHLYQAQFPQIHQAINAQLNNRDWVLYEPPKAYTWDPESREFFTELGLSVDIKESFYTSIHYVVKPREDSPYCCEIQVRTLFEEIWGEIDHQINYPKPTESLSCKEQIKVLARLSGAGSRLTDSIYRTYLEYLENRDPGPR